MKERTHLARQDPAVERVGVANGAHEILLHLPKKKLPKGEERAKIMKMCCTTTNRPHDTDLFFLKALPNLLQHAIDDGSQPLQGGRTHQRPCKVSGTKNQGQKGGEGSHVLVVCTFVSQEKRTTRQLSERNVHQRGQLFLGKIRVPGRQSVHHVRKGGRGKRRQVQEHATQRCSRAGSRELLQACEGVTGGG